MSFGRVGWRPSAMRSIRWLAACLAAPGLWGCGATTRDPEQRAGSPGVASGGSSSGAGASAAGGAPLEQPFLPPARIAGRWAMFPFEDPVGVQLLQEGEKLQGRGCAAGVPPRSYGLEDLCGDLSGSVRGNAAEFGFRFALGESYYYAAETIVSGDGQRMTGKFFGIGGQSLTHVTAWLRVADDQAWLEEELEMNSSGSGRYELTLIEASPGASEYVAGRTYALNYAQGRYAYGDLGPFWWSEMKRLEAGVVEVGPVAATSPALAVSMSLHFSADGLMELAATTASGNEYRFRAARSPAP